MHIGVSCLGLRSQRGKWKLIGQRLRGRFGLIAIPIAIAWLEIVVRIAQPIPVQSSWDQRWQVFGLDRCRVSDEIQQEHQ